MISYQLKYIEGDLYINGITSSLSEATAYALSGYLASKIGIKISMVLSFIIACIGMICLILLPQTQIVLIFCILGSKFGIS